MPGSAARLMASFASATALLSRRAAAARRTAAFAPSAFVGLRPRPAVTGLSKRDSERGRACGPFATRHHGRGPDLHPTTAGPAASRSALCTRMVASTADAASASSSSTSNAGAHGDDGDALLGIEWVRSSVVQALDELFDPVEIARGAAMAKLDGKKKKKKKKKKNATAEAEAAPAPAPMTEEERSAIIAAAVAAAKPFSPGDAMVTAATRPDFGDYQCNAALSLAGPAGLTPRECAQKIADALAPRLEGVAELPLEIAGPGFINVRLRDEYLQRALGAMARESGGRLAVPETGQKQKIVVDFSSPNIAKEMHVGHLRSTIIGDTLSNVLSFAGHDVLRLNHVGDWGTQFGMLVEHLRDEFPAALRKETAKDVDLGDLVLLYKAAKRRFDADEAFKTRAREGVVKLQAGDAETLAAWESLCAASRAEYQQIYDRLGIEGLHERGESFYNRYLNGVVGDLERQGLAVESEGATVVFLDGYFNRDGSPLPMLVRKSDGGFNYATTDLAAIRHRVQMDPADGGERADRVLYVTDAGQAQHFEMVFAAAGEARFLQSQDDGAVPSLEHVPFGLVQGEDGKKFATRSGDTVRLKDLLDEAVRIAGDDIRSRTEDPAVQEEAELPEALAEVARTVGVGAVKYADLSMNRESNYKFSYGRMLSLNGNTAPYMLYAYARICGIVRKSTGQSDAEKVVWPEAAAEILITHDAEKQLMRNLVKLPDILSEVESDLYPNRLCDYLFETSQKFNKFYESCSVNNAETPELKASRLSLCTVSAATIRLLMNLLGIAVVEKF